jgi:hypothetical protein
MVRDKPYYNSTVILLLGIRFTVSELELTVSCDS